MGVINDNVSRRRFLSSAFMGFGAFFGMGLMGVRFLQFLIPEKKEKRSEEILVGKEKDFSGGSMAVEAAGSKILILKTEKGLAAFSRRCTDLGCLVNWDPAKEVFVCPCHRGVYDRNGKNISGPPPRPLERFPVVARGENIYIKIKA